MIVVDTSVAVKWVVEEDRREEAKLVLRNGAGLLAPDFMVLEAANALRRKVRRGETSVEQMRMGMNLINQSVRLLPTGDFARAAIDLALELDHSPYDCCFLACASEYGVMISDDEVFLRKCRTNRFGDLVLSLSQDGLETALQRFSRFDQR